MNRLPIPHAFGEQPVLKVMYAAVIRAAQHWRGIMVGEFEQRQLRVIRDELNRAHAERVAPAGRRETRMGQWRHDRGSSSGPHSDIPTVSSQPGAIR